jgi:RimJ/RimL family protein N-acetyltransferase
LLYDLLGERDASINISHRQMPSFGDHVRFIEGRPYYDWNFVYVGDEIVGAIYLTDADEIGIFVYGKHRGLGYGRKAIIALMDKHGRRRYLANINPRNDPSRALFVSLGFAVCQHTYEKRT